VQQLQFFLNKTRNLMSKHVQEMLEWLEKTNNVINKCEMTVNGAMELSYKSFSKDYTWHMPFLCWFIIYNFEFQIPHLTLHLKYKYILTTNWFYIMYIIHSCTLSHIYEQLFIKATFTKFIILRVKNTFEPNVFKWVIKQFSLVQVLLPF